MQQKEFEALTGAKVSAEEYAKIERVYMSIDGMEKEEFCSAWKRGDLCHIVDELVDEVRTLEVRRSRLKAELGEAEDKAAEAATVLLTKAFQYNDDELKQAAIELVGMQQAVLIDVENGFGLNAAERAYIMENL